MLFYYQEITSTSMNKCETWFLNKTLCTAYLNGSNLHNLDQSKGVAIAIMMSCFFFSRFNAQDSKGGQALPHVVNIRLCRCNSSSGTCNFDRLVPGTDEASNFQIVECQCNPGWTGYLISRHFNCAIENKFYDLVVVCLRPHSLRNNVITPGVFNIIYKIYNYISKI